MGMVDHYWAWLDEIRDPGLSAQVKKIIAQEGFRIHPDAPVPPRCGSGQTTAREGVPVGYQPRSSYYDQWIKAQKEAVQLQKVNNKLSAEVHRLREDLRLKEEEAGESSGGGALELAEDALLRAEGNLRKEKAYAKGFFSTTLLATPATFALAWGAAVVSPTPLVALLVFFTFAVGVIALSGATIAIAKIFGALPEAREEVAQKRQHLNRVTLKELGIS